MQQAINNLLNSVEAPSLRPDCILPTVLWYFEDCTMDKLYGNILTEANLSRPRMSITLCHEDGTPLSPPEFSNVRMIADLIVRQLLEKYSKDPHAQGVKLLTKLVFKSLFHTEYCQAILELEAEEWLLCLCTRHWKAEVMLSQAFL
jgi:hypothetical protein